MPEDTDIRILNQCRTQLQTLANAIPTETDPTARDWSGFFAALAAFMANVLPLIIPLFAKLADQKK